MSRVMPDVHPTAIVDPRAQLAGDVRIEPYAIIGPDVYIGAGTIVRSHCVLEGALEIGARCRIGPAAYLGLDPQHLGFLAAPDRPITWAIIGDDALIRESATVHRATKGGRENATRIGNHCTLMAGAHVAHDCKLADHVIMANAALLGGHMTIGERAFIGGGTAIHQHCRVGRLAMVAGNQAVGHDVPPFAAVLHDSLKGYNAIGCKRAGLSREAIHSVRSAWHFFHTIRTIPLVLERMRQIEPMTPEVREIIDFITSSKRGILRSARFVDSNQ